ncbi:threonine dehydratase [Streptomyces inusitatus]|uniref:Threonine dehydratase n=1 Tax=Streptomyces inusitatus TaxID=68221 RepID=A0A918PJB9_9ACTN|nr:serine/threonine dehydratase [Streptomyces inusitatus]GGZ12945.1 threonine dehydratase [Streptomyces inusitatus]
MPDLTHGDVEAAAGRVLGRVRPVAVSPLDPSASGEPSGIWLALEYMQHTGSFKARGAVNFLRAHQEGGTLPEAGVTIASGGNAGLAMAWAARAMGVRATVFLPATAPGVKVARLKGYEASVRLIEGEYADAAEACAQYAALTGALPGHAYDDPFVAAGAGTLLEELRTRIPGLDTVIVAVGGGGLFAGVATAAHHHGIRTVAVEPENSRALNAALLAGAPVDVTVDSIANDALGARRASGTAVEVALRTGSRSLLVPDSAIAAARQTLWDQRRIVTELSGATALAALPLAEGGGGYEPGPGEQVAVVLCGANTDPSDLIAGAGSGTV